MDNIPSLNINDFVYNLPEEKIAKYPLPERDQSKLLIWKDGKISESVFADIDRVLPENSLLISNNTRVIHARLIFYRPTGARIEILCLEPWLPADYRTSFQQCNSVEWKCLVGNAKKWKQGILEQPVVTGNKTILLRAEMTGKDEQGFIIRFFWDFPDTFATVIEAAGEIPIPPYLNRSAEESDNLRYQTMYAKVDGSVAAPTAGLHFTEKVIQKLVQKNIRFAELTLHTGAGTFQPVKSEWIAGHTMHTETVVISREFLLKILRHKGKIIAVGTTSVRSLESLYWLGLKITSHPVGELLHLGQWEPYKSRPSEEPGQSLQNILDFMHRHGQDHFIFTTSIIIVPGYHFRLMEGMITNFHQPRSTLLLLIAAFLGPGWREVYDYALTNNFRFLSYGDSNLYWKG